MTKLNLVEVTETTVLESSIKDYNEYEWKRIVKRYSSYNKCKFYKDTKSDRDTFYVVYELGGILFFKEVSYISALTNASFSIVRFDYNTGDVTFEGRGENNERIENTPKNRLEMASVNSLGIIFTNEF